MKKLYSHHIKPFFMHWYFRWKKPHLCVKINLHDYTPKYGDTFYKSGSKKRYLCIGNGWYLALPKKEVMIREAQGERAVDSLTESATKAAGYCSK